MKCVYMEFILIEDEKFNILFKNLILLFVCIYLNKNEVDFI